MGGGSNVPLEDENITEIEAPIESNITSNIERNTIPPNCIAWYDGCNDCGRQGENILCTMKYCTTYEPFVCKTWK